MTRHTHHLHDMTVWYGVFSSTYIHSYIRTYAHTYVHAFSTLTCHSATQTLRAYCSTRTSVCSRLSKRAVRALEGRVRLLWLLAMSSPPSTFFSSDIVFHVEGEVSVESYRLEYPDAYAFSLSSTLQLKEVRPSGYFWSYGILFSSGGSIMPFFRFFLLSVSVWSLLSLLPSVSFRSVLTGWD